MSADPGSSGIQFYDAHCHLYDADLQPVLQWDQADEKLPLIGAHVINGTHPDDWEKVSSYPGLGNAMPLRAYGVHPWRVDVLPEDWELQLRTCLKRDGVSVGEIGLDCWIEPRDDGLQKSIFMKQLQIAAELDLPPSIHCVRAYGALLDCLKAAQLPQSGFLAHGFGGSREVLYQLIDLGGYVSFSAYGAHPGRKRIRDAIRACPLDRLLIETDAPDMVPPEETCRFPLLSGTGKRLHHPAELLTAYEWIADLKGIELDKLAVSVGQNFQRLFGKCASF